MKCSKCDVDMIEGVCLENSFEYTRGGVFSCENPKSDGTLVDCIKCPECGKSEIKEK